MARNNSVLFYNLESELARAGISKSDLASIIGISVSAIYAKMSGVRSFKLGEVKMITRYLSIATDKDLTIEYLFETD